MRDRSEMWNQMGKLHRDGDRLIVAVCTNLSALALRLVGADVETPMELGGRHVDVAIGNVVSVTTHQHTHIVKF